METLLFLRKNRGLTQKDIADQLGISRQAYANYETGNREPDLNTLKQLAEFFGVTVDYLLRNGESETDELSEYLEELKNRSEMRTLFSLAKGATKEDVMKAVAIIEALKKTDG